MQHWSASARANGPNRDWRARFGRLLFALSVIVALLAAGTPLDSAHAADPFDTQAAALLARLSVEQRVGQLMLVTFQGTDLGTESTIARLIRDNHIGGVYLLASNDNIDGGDSAAAHVQALANNLQQIAYNTTLNDSGKTITPFVPLFIASTDEGDSLPGAQFVSGTTALPSDMAIGATWEPAYARRVGNIAGQELNAMGVNLMLGPTLDVVQNSSDSGPNLGTQSFGGEPWWVGRMAQSYIAGVHEGSSNRIAVAPRHFPGLGSSDRRPDQEAPVVPRTAEELRRFDLVPFFAITGRPLDPGARADGLQCVNIRYQGENIRAVTRPACIDQQSLGDLLAMEGIATWRADGGLMISDSLGTRAMRRWYDATPFPHRQPARDALLAGNDVLLLDDFGMTSGADAFDNIVDTIKFFSNLYKSDPVFKARVDQAVKRVLKQKLRLYNSDFTLNNVMRDKTLLDSVGNNSAELYTIARDAVTLIAPQRQRLPAPPTYENRMVILTDTRGQQQCSMCISQPVIRADALENAILRLYGPQASGQVNPTHLESYSFNQLNALLAPNAPGQAGTATPETETLSMALNRADWIVFAMLDVSADAPGSDAVRHFLEARPDLLSKAHVVVLAFGAPYYLSSTDISKLSAYYGLYSSADPFIDAAARALFGEASYHGALPVSVPGISYDLIQATSPDPGQTIRLVPEAAPGAPNNTPRPTSAIVPTTVVGDTLYLRTEPILDRNGHSVPDGTPVVFTLSFVTEGVQRRQNAATINGVARTSFVLSRSGLIQITAASLDAATSVTFQVNVAENALAATLQTILPPSPTRTPSQSPTASFTPTVSATTTPTLTHTPLPPTARPTETPSITPSNTWTTTPSVTTSATSSPTATASYTPTWTPTYTYTPTFTATATATMTITLTATASPTATFTATPTRTMTSTPVPAPPNPPRVSLRDFAGVLLALMLISVFGFVLGWTLTRTLDGGLRVLLSCTVAGLVGYIYYGVGLPGADSLQSALLITFAAGVGGLVVGWWSVRRYQARLSG